MKKYILLLYLSVLVSVSLFGDGSFYGEVGYTPGLIDFIWIESAPDNHTLKSSYWGLDLTTEYFPGRRFGFGQETQWRGINKISVRSGSFRYSPDELEGNHYFLRFSPQFLYAPLRKEKHMISLGLGFSFSMGYFLSDSTRDFKDFYVGSTMKIRYRYLISEFLYLSAGWSLALDYVYFGQFNELVFNNFIQIQNTPVLGIGYHR